MTSPLNSRPRRVHGRARHRRVDQHLAAGGRPTGVTQAQGHGGGHGAAGALTGHGHGGRRHAECSALPERPLGHRHTVVDGRRIRVLGRQAVADRHHDRARGVGQLTGHAVHDADAPHHVAAPVEVHDEARRLAVVPVDPDGDAFHGVVVDVVDLLGELGPVVAPGQLEDHRVEVGEGRGPLGVGGHPRLHPRVEHAFVVAWFSHGDLRGRRRPGAGRPWCGSRAEPRRRRPRR